MARRYRVRRKVRHEMGAKFNSGASNYSRIRVVTFAFIVLFSIITFRLFTLMVLNNGLYTALAAGSHDIYAELFPERGKIYLEGADNELLPLALNRDKFLVFADTRIYEDPKTPLEVTNALTAFFQYEDERKTALLTQLEKKDDVYEQIEKNIDEETMNRLKDLKLPGIYFSRFPERYYPEGSLAAHVIGFVGKTAEGTDTGRYGIEGYWNETIGGSVGFLEGVRSAKGTWIPLAGRSFEQAVDGANLVLTLDRTVEYEACKLLADAVQKYEAETGSLVIMDPKTGALIAMCSMPDFDPNQYGKVEDIGVYNNISVFEPYEPGSVFKPLIMAGALNEGILTPYDYFHDTGSAEANCTKPIHNANLKSFGDQTMTGVLENSINTGMVYVANKLGKPKLRSYVEKFGFGVKSGIELATENSGTIDSLYQNKSDKVDCYTATASFGQGVTVTPLQLASAFSAVANGGMLMKPYVVKRIEHANGKVEDIRPIEVRSVIDKKTASLISGMMVRVVDYGEGSRGKVPGYYVAGKTGTAQIPGPGGYSEFTNHSFVGFGPADDPKFVVVIRLEKTKLTYASTTAAPLFSSIASYLMTYYHIPPER